LLRPVACVLTMFPRFSETFVLDEKDVARARARVIYVSELKARSARALTAALRRVPADPDSGAAWARAGHARVERDFDLSRSVGRPGALLEEAVVA
jgi:hypothetical protein